MSIDELLKKSIQLANDCGVSKNITVSTYNKEVLINFGDWEYSGNDLESILLEAVHNLEEYDKELKEMIA